MKKTLLFSGMFLLGGVLAHASLIPTLASITPSGNVADPFQWNYNVTLSGDESLNPSGTATSDPPGTFFTLYDVSSSAPLVIGVPIGWSSSTQLTGITPSGITPTDSASLYDVTFRYTGPFAAPGVPTVISGFAMDFATNTQALGVFSYQASQFNTTLTNGMTDNGKGFSIIPGVATSTPEPTTGLAWLTSGLVGIGLLRRKLARK